MMKIAALWAGEKDGRRYLSGSLELPAGASLALTGSQRLLILPNQSSTGNQPTHHLFLTEDNREGAASDGQTETNAGDIPF